MQLDRERIEQICNAFASPGNFAVGDRIPRRKAANALESLRLPEYDEIVALADFTAFGSNSNGLAIGLHGIYWYAGESEGGGTLTWRELAQTALRLEGAAVSFGIGLSIPANTALTPEEGLDLLTQLRAEAAEAAASPETRREDALFAQIGGALREFRDTLTGEARNDCRLPGEIPEAKLRNAREKFSIPGGERVLGLLDFTRFGNNKVGLAIGVRGLYWRNRMGGSMTLGLAELARCNIRVEGSWVWMDERHAIDIDVFSSIAAPDVARLLTMLQGAVRDAPAPASKAGRESPETASILADRVTPTLPDGAFPGGQGELVRRVTPALQALGAGDTRYRTWDRVPPERRGAARAWLDIPDVELPVALVELSGDDEMADGLAIGSRGIYWRSPCDDAPHSVGWSELVSETLAEHPTDPCRIELGTERCIATAWPDERDRLLDLLIQVRGWAIPPETAPAAPPAASAPPLPPPPTSSRRWLLATDGQQTGPFDEPAILALLSAGRVDPDRCFAWTEGMPQWLPFRNVPDLDVLVAPPLPSAPPPPPPGVTAPPPPPGAPPAAGRRVVDF